MSSTITLISHQTLSNVSNASVENLSDSKKISKFLKWILGIVSDSSEREATKALKDILKSFIKDKHASSQDLENFIKDFVNQEGPEAAKDRAKNLSGMAMKLSAFCEAAGMKELSNVLRLFAKKVEKVAQIDAPTREEMDAFQKRGQELFNQFQKCHGLEPLSHLDLTDRQVIEHLYKALKEETLVQALVQEDRRFSRKVSSLKPRH